MKSTTIVGIILIVCGVVALASQGGLDTAQATRKLLPIPPLLGGLSVAVGILLVIVGGGASRA